MANEFNELARVIDSVSKDKGIEKETILEAVNESVVAAAHKLMKIWKYHYQKQKNLIQMFK